MKKLTNRGIAILLAVLVCMVVFSVSVFATETDAYIIAQGSCGENTDYVLYGTGLLEINGTGEVIFDFINISQPDKISSVDISEDITAISGTAFKYCNNLTYIEYPENIKFVGDISYFGCDSLTDVYIPDTATSDGGIIENDAFRDVSKMQSIKIPTGVTAIGESAFAFCSELTEVIIPDSVTAIGKWIFMECYQLTGVDIPDSVTTISGEAFAWSCSKIEKIEYPENVTITGEISFIDSRNLEEVIVPESAKSDGGSIGNEAFSNKRIKYFRIPNGVRSIDAYAFKRCFELENVYIPESVLSIDESAFEGCKKLASIVLPEGLETIGRRAFYDCSGITGELRIPDSVNTIGEWAFANCSGINSLVFPDKLPTIGECAFWELTGLTNFDFVTWDFLLKAVHAFTGFSKITSFDIPDDVTSIPAGMFSGWESLKSIDIPDGVTEIGSITFANCDALESIELPPSIKKIGDSAFYDSGLKSIKIHSNIESIDRNAFENCSYLEEIIIEEGLKTIGAYAFESCESLKEIEIPRSVTEVGERAFACCSNISVITIHRSIPNFVEMAYAECPRLETVIVADDVEQMEKKSITGDEETNIDTVVFQGNAPTFNSAAFKGVTVTAYYPKGNKTWTDSIRKQYGGKITWKSYEAPKAPTIKSSNVASSGKIKLTWNKVNGAAEYKVYRATSKTGKYSHMKTVTGTSYTNTSAKPGKYYYYYVVAIGVDGTESKKSNIVGRTCDYAQPEVTATNDAATGKPKLTWKAVEGATSYKVYRAATKNGSYSLMMTVKNGATSYINNSAVAGKTYYYKVKAYGPSSSATSVYSVVDSRTCDLKRPVVSITTSSGKPKISWAAVTGAKEYKIYRATSKNGTYKAVYTTKNKSWKDTTAVKGKTYYYRVVAVHKNSNANSAKSVVKSIKCTK